MSAHTLTRRTAQLDLLAEACRQHLSARAAVTRSARDVALVRTHFVAMEGRSLLLARPQGGIPDEALHNGALDVYFAVDGRRLGFRTQPVGPATWTDAAGSVTECWRVRIPLSVQPRQQRAHRRIRLEHVAPLTVTLTAVRAPAWECQAKLENISRGGLGAILTGRPSEMLRAGELYWARFGLDEGRPCEFIVRLMHARHIDPDDVTLLGCMFCPGEDPLQSEQQMQRIEHFVWRQGGKPPAQAGEGA